jgi:hypothetical protein
VNDTTHSTRQLLHAGVVAEVALNECTCCCAGLHSQEGVSRGTIEFEAFAAADRQWVVSNQLNRQIAASVPKNVLSHCVAMSDHNNDSRALRGYDDNDCTSPAGSGR